MGLTRINVADYYDNPAYYSAMPQTIFDALETAFMAGQDTAEVNKAEFDEMIRQYNAKNRQ